MAGPTRKVLFGTGGTVVAGVGIEDDSRAEYDVEV